MLPSARQRRVESARERRRVEAIVRHSECRLIALDLGRNLGVALGLAGTMHPQSLTIAASRAWDDRAETFAAIRHFIEEQLSHFANRPLFVVKEAPPHIKGFLTLNDSSASARTTLGYHAIVEASCALYEVPCFERPVQTVRLHFIGRGNLPRAEAKAAVLARCHELGYLPADCHDTDRADALAVFDFASVHIAHRAPPELFFFQQTGT